MLGDVKTTALLEYSSNVCVIECVNVDVNTYTCVSVQGLVEKDLVERLLCTIYMQNGIHHFIYSVCICSYIRS